MNFSPVNVAFDGANIWVANKGSGGTVNKLLASTGALVGTYSAGFLSKHSLSMGPTSG